MNKLSECTEKPKELWETLKSLGMPKKTLISNFNAVESNNALTFDKKNYSKNFQRLLLIFSRISLNQTP